MNYPFTRLYARHLMDQSVGKWAQILRDAGLPLTIFNFLEHSCPVCGSANSFITDSTVFLTGAVSCRVCFHVASTPIPGNGLATLQWYNGWTPQEALYWLNAWHMGLQLPRCQFQRTSIDFSSRVLPSLRKSSLANTLSPLPDLAESSYQGMPNHLRETLARHLGFSNLTLQRLRVGWIKETRSTAWPMVGADNSVIGIQTRTWMTNHKCLVKGSLPGMFVPSDLPLHLGRLFICEGPIDTAAILSMGLNAVGRSSALGPIFGERNLIARLAPAECVVIADSKHEIPFAHQLAEVLADIGKAVRMITLPDGVNDICDWIRKGASMPLLTAIADASKLLSDQLDRGV